MLTWGEKFSLLTTKGLTWKEVQELDKGLEDEKNAPPKEEPPKDEPPEDEPPKDEPPKDEPTEREKQLLEKIDELENKLTEIQQDNVHGNSGGNEPSFDEQLDSMFKDYRF